MWAIRECSFFTYISIYETTVNKTLANIVSNLPVTQYYFFVCGTCIKAISHWQLCSYTPYLHPYSNDLIIKPENNNKAN